MIVKRKAAMMLAALLIAVAVAVVAGALAARPDRSDRPGAGGETAPGTAVTRSTAPTTSASGKPGTVHTGAHVDPRKGRTFCATTRLLVRFSTEAYGLSKSGLAVDGEQFRRRLVILTGTFERLALQSRKDARTRAAEASWTTLAEATALAEDRLRAVGLDVQSQTMIVEIAQLGRVTRTELPKAVASIDRVCGISQSELGLRS